MLAAVTRLEASAHLKRPQSGGVSRLSSMFGCCRAPAAAAPMKVQVLKCSQVLINGVTLEWGIVEQTAVHIEVRCRHQKGGKWTGVRLRVASTTFLAMDPRTRELVPRGNSESSNYGSAVVDGLDEDCVYEFKACVIGPGGTRGPFSDILTCRTLTKAKQEPVKLNVDEVGSGSATISWIPQCTGTMRLHVRQIGTDTWRNISTAAVGGEGGSMPTAAGGASAATVTSPLAQKTDSCCSVVTIRDLLPQESYEVKGTMVSSDAYIPNVDTVPLVLTTLPAGQPAARLMRLTCAGTAQSAVDLKWSKIPGRWFVMIRARRPAAIAEGAGIPPGEYRFVDRFTGGLVNAVDSWAPALDDEGITVNQLKSGELYCFSARTLGPDGVWSPWGEEIEVVTQIVMPPLLVGKTTSSTVHFEWTPPDHAVNIAVKVRREGDRTWQHVNSKTNHLVPLGDGIALRSQEAALFVLGLEPDTIYEATASVRTVHGWGPPGAKVVFRTLPVTILDAECIGASSTSMNVHLNLPASTATLPVSLRCRQQGESDWNEVAKDGQSLVPIGQGAKFADGAIQITNLQKDAVYEVATSRSATSELPLVVKLGASPHPRVGGPAKSCAKFRRCREALVAKLQDTPMIVDDLLEEYDKCFCPGCHTGPDVYQRGNADYIIPKGWCKVAVRTNRAKALEKVAFETWNTCYHGTTAEYLHSILTTGQLLKPGSTLVNGTKIPIRDGHIQKGFERKNHHNGAVEFFDPSKYIFFSPSMAYCDYGFAYMTEFTHETRRYRFAVQVRIQPNTYSIGPETVGAKRRGHTIDPNVSNNSIEWYTTEDHTHMITGVLVCER